MTITFEMTAYILTDMAFGEGEPSPILLDSRIGSPGREVLHVQCFDSERAVRPDTLVFLREEQLPALLERRGREAVQAVVVSSAPLPPHSAGFRKADNAVFVRTDRTLAALADALQDRLAALLRADAAFSAGILERRRPEELFPLGKEFLPLDYTIVDIDMNAVYCTPGYAASRDVKDARLPGELFQDLISHQEFHQAAEKKESFYYYSHLTDTTDRCRNIVVKDQYIARLVAVLRRNEQRLPPGGEQLFEALAGHIQSIYSHMNLLPVRHSGDLLHGLCRDVLSGKSVNRTAVGQVLASYGWGEGHRFVCTVLRFSAGSGWDAQLLTMLPYLATSLENLWSSACAFPVAEEGEVWLVLDLSVRGAGTVSEFLQKLAYFIRDNLCKAGISPEFTGFGHLYAAGRAAAAALEFGSVRRPDFWYYRFDDFRLAYCLDSLQKELPAEMICHPALVTLARHDRTNGTRLRETLQTYLACNLNMTAAAERLYLHRTSFCRRMNQIRKLTGLDFDDADTVLTLQISCRLFPESGS